MNHQLISYRRVADLYCQEEAIKRPHRFTDSGWMDRSARLGIYQAILNSIDAGNIALANFIDTLTDSDLARQAMDFANKRKEALFEYTSAGSVEKRVALRTQLVEKFLQA